MNGWMDGWMSRKHCVAGVGVHVRGGRDRVVEAGDYVTADEVQAEKVKHVSSRA